MLQFFLTQAFFHFNTHPVATSWMEFFSQLLPVVVKSFVSGVNMFLYFKFNICERANTQSAKNQLANRNNQIVSTVR